MFSTLPLKYKGSDVKLGNNQSRQKTRQCGNRIYRVGQQQLSNTNVSRSVK